MIFMCINHAFILFPGESEILKFHGQKNLDANLNRQHMNPASNGRPYFSSVGKTYRIRNGYTVTLECSIENLGEENYLNFESRGNTLDLLSYSIASGIPLALTIVNC